MIRLSVELYQKPGGRYPFEKTMQKLGVSGKNQARIRNAITRLEEEGWEHALEMNLISSYEGAGSREIHKLNIGGRTQYRISLFRVLDDDGHTSRVFLCEVEARERLNSDSQVKTFVSRAETMRMEWLRRKA